MAVKIRLARRGRKKLALYDVVVADERAPRDGRFIEKIGTYNPNTDPASININNDRALKWLLNGAQPTDTVKAMLSYRGVLIRKHLQIGVLKGAVTQEDADRRFEEWRENKEAAISGKVSRLSDAKADARQKAFDAETAKNKARLEAIKKREEEAIAASKAAEAPAEEETPVEEAPKEEATKAESPKEEARKEEAAKAESPKEEAPKEETPKAEAKEEAPKTEAPKEDASKEESPKAEAKEEAPKEDAPKAEASKEDAPKEESPKAEAKEEAPKEESSKAEATKEETPKEEAPKEEAPKEEAPKGDASKEESPAADSSESDQDKKA